MIGQKADDALEKVEVIIPSLNRRFTGVTASVEALLPYQSETISMAGYGWHLSPLIRALSFPDLIKLVRQPVTERPFRLYHARRNIEMCLGLLLRWLSGGRLRLVLTSALPRKPSWLTRVLVKRCDGLIVVHPQVEINLGRRADRIIFHGVNTDTFRPAPSRSLLWQELAYGGKAGIACLGRLRPSKGTDLFVEAMIALLRLYPDYTAVIAGDTRPKDEAYVTGLKTKVEQAGLGKRVVFAGFLGDEDRRRLLSGASLVVAPSRREGFGLVPLEALASGTPVVASRAGAFADILNQCPVGESVATGDLKALIEAIRRALESPLPLSERARLARSYVESQFSIKQEAEEILAFYHDLWGKRR